MGDAPDAAVFLRRAADECRQFVYQVSDRLARLDCAVADGLRADDEATGRDRRLLALLLDDARRFGRLIELAQEVVDTEDTGDRRAPLLRALFDRRVDAEAQALDAAFPGFASWADGFDGAAGNIRRMLESRPPEWVGRFFSGGPVECLDTDPFDVGGWEARRIAARFAD